MLKYPPYCIRTERLTIRCWKPEDAPLLKTTIDRNLHHLRRFMAWAIAEPSPVEQKVELLRFFRSRFDSSQDYVYGVFSKDESEVLGGTGLHTRRGPAAFEIGYWIDRKHVRQGLATEVAQALVACAFSVQGIDRVEIRCDVENEASAAIPRKLGFALEATLRRRNTDFPGELRDQLVWTLFREEAAPGFIRRFGELEAYDAAGNRVPADQ